jgi:hypothetical protein
MLISYKTVWYDICDLELEQNISLSYEMVWYDIEMKSTLGVLKSICFSQ